MSLMERSVFLLARNSRQADEKRAADANKKASNLDKAITKFMGFADPSYEPIQDIVDRNDRFQKVLNQQNDIIHGIPSIIYARSNWYMGISDLHINYNCMYMGIL